MEFENFSTDWGADKFGDDVNPSPVPTAAVDIENSDFYFGSVDEFVREYLRFVYRRRIDGRQRCWAAKWWEHEEARIRLEALWRSWEHLRWDLTTGMSVWWRDHADYHMAILMDPDGPFAAATEGTENTSKKGEPLPYIAPPPGMFPPPRTTPQADPPGIGEWLGNGPSRPKNATL